MLYRVFFLICCLYPGLWLQPGQALGGQTDPVKGEEHFEKKVRPILDAKCLSCHGGKEKVRGGLRVDSLAGLLKGGERGPAIKPGKPEESLLISAVNHGDIVQMPPKSKLKPAEIAALTHWIRIGAPWPGTSKAVTAMRSAVRAFTREERGFWAFQRPRSSRLPRVRQTEWIQSPIDAYMLAALEQHGLKPAPAADKRTLIRRVTFDLTGLPPTPAAIDAFVRDESPAAFARVVDRLLNSPHYGERWGRHWLDVARYADSNGMDENLAQTNAYRYRDYVVKALNTDKPYDQFVREQLAGDLLPSNGKESDELDHLIATGFLSLGPKMLAEDDPVKMEMDIIDEQVDTIGRTFMALTLGCARCHDHKFDPILMPDYYGLAGIFKSTKTMEHFRVVARWYERPLAPKKEQDRLGVLQGKIDQMKRELDGALAEARKDLAAEGRKEQPRYVAAAREYLAQSKDSVLASVMAGSDAGKSKAVVIEAENYNRGNLVKDFETYGKQIGVIYNKGELPNFSEYDVTLPTSGAYQLELRYAAAESRSVRLLLNGQLARSDAAERVTGTWFPDSQHWAAEVVFAFSSGKNTIRLERDGPFPHFDKLALVPRPLPSGQGILVPMSPEQFARKKGLHAIFVKQWVDFLTGRERAPSDEELRLAGLDPLGPFNVPVAAEESLAKEARAGLAKRREAIAALEKTRPALPEVMGATEGTATNLKIHIRGNHLTLGEEVARGFPAILTGGGPSPIGKIGSGRLELGRWLTEANHPLTARVLVNRLWHWHFGAGLVRSPDNFGKLGERPTHPELLDWLATEFVRQGWSIKAMHRQILLSSTYQMSTRFDARAAEVDPENRLHWRHGRRRLSAEEIRDTLIALGGKLNPSLGGSLMLGKNRTYVIGYPNSTYDRYDFGRRSIYLPVIRSDLYNVFQAFDFADPSTPNGDRATTTVAPQALFMMNSPLMLEESKNLATGLLRSMTNDEGAALGMLYESAYGRSPTNSERDRAMMYVHGMEADLRAGGKDAATARHGAWQSLCRIILAANEFVYLE